ncbi:MAG: tRNA pseudouridine(55) synthase TruB [Staphylococcus sp.]|jgi:tRNA pseudouridine synthase B|nr:tRNA pseudouridine(55) synthase TruB [Staphylococcus sp.]
MNGIIVINKEKGMTSHDVVNQVRKIFKTKKVGHLGTLDPNATGVLAICINDATKLVQFLLEHNKTYIARVCLGKKTDTYDLDGTIISSVKVEKIDVTKLDDIIKNFIGKQLQVPPIYSSIKVNGKKLYEYARNNEKVNILPREIEVYKIKRISELVYENECCFFDLYLEVSKGTYIRSLCLDIGAKMNIPSSMAELCRIKLGNFDIKDSYTFKDISEGNYRLITMTESLNDLPFFSSEEVIKKAKFGMKIDVKMILENLIDKPKKIAIGEKNELIAIYELTSDLNYYKAVRVWN